MTKESDRLATERSLENALRGIQQKASKAMNDAWAENDRLANWLAELGGGEPNAPQNNFRSALSKLKALKDYEATAEKLGYTSAAKALDALSRTKPEKLITLPDWSLRQPAEWTTTFGLTETKAATYHKSILRELRLLLAVVPDYFETADQESIDGWKRHFNTTSPQSFTDQVRRERDMVIDPEIYELTQAEEKDVNPTRGELHRLLERHFKPLFGRESDWELVKAHDDQRYYAAQQVATLDAALSAGGQQSLNEALAFLEPTLFALAGFSEVEYRGLQYDGELPQGAALLEQLRKELPTSREGWLTSERTELLTY